MKLCFFVEEFYTERASWTEMLDKQHRPYLMLRIAFDTGECFIPFRSNISHQNAFFTKPPTRAGLDFSKAIFLSQADTEKYIAKNKRPHLDEEEYEFLVKNEQHIKRKMLEYVELYKEAKQELHIPRKAILARCSTLQYFEEFIN